MNPEPLRGKELEDFINRDFKSSFTHEDVQSAIEFYKKYRDNYYLFMKDNPDLERQYLDEISKFLTCTYHPTYYRNWLFDYTFQDVIE